ncbi:MFS transporter [uncultured Zhongshania sp.]|uniref:MFS transporter n=1 Tax=uncultured Zhongshania sp. TaxID=1642288 RepID=UPI0025D38481|nr:MFS transporter [uncultured Zhongshania sp.]
MRRLLLPLTALLLSDALLLVGHGLMLTLLPLRAEIEQFTATQTGLTASTYFVGFVISCLVTPHIVRRVGHIRSFAVLATIFSAVVLLFHGLPSFVAWLVLRFVVGFCISGLYMVIESWLNDRATRETRGTILSLYTVINLSMIIVGQQMLNFADPSGPVLFGLAAILLSLAIVPVCLTATLAPTPMPVVKLNFRRLWQLSHVGMEGAITSGLVTGAFWALGPVYARGLGLDTSELTLFMSGAVLGGALFQLPLGRLSDRYDRRLVLYFNCLAGAAVSMVLVFVPAIGNLLLLLSVLWGGAVMTMYSICLAHTSDNAEASDFVLIGSGILFLFGCSSALGAPLASIFMSLLGPPGLFVFSAVCLLGFTLGISIRRKSHVLPLVDSTEPFVPVSVTSPMIFELDPRTEDADVAQAAGGEQEEKSDGEAKVVEVIDPIER